MGGVAALFGVLDGGKRMEMSKETTVKCDYCRKIGGESEAYNWFSLHRPSGGFTSSVILLPVCDRDFCSIHCLSNWVTENAQYFRM